MKKSMFYLQVFLVFIFISCSDSDFLQEPKKNIFEKESNLISPQEAASIATKALTEFEMNIGKSTRAVSDTWKVSNIFRYPSVITRTLSDGEKAFYIINFEEGGFAIVPSDKRATDVYAFSTEGSFDIEKNESLKCFMSLATDYLNEDIALQPRELQPVPGPDDIRNYLIDWYGGEKCYAKSTVSTTKPYYLLNTKWHQHEPYRMYCFTTSGENAAAGCVAIAMAQIMAYHKKPLSYNNHTYL